MVIADVYDQYLDQSVQNKYDVEWSPDFIEPGDARRVARMQNRGRRVEHRHIDAK
ncbi:MAG: hypothetical protein GWN81_15645 [Phycisphaerae bacterium]|nr:hypothetical protein [Phycisphaerae bacterium]NIU10246.1 hypothetical protein [Phycisphaerae bacterium]